MKRSKQIGSFKKNFSTKMGQMETTGRKSNKRKHTNARKDRRTDKRADRQTEGKIGLGSTDIDQ